MVKTIKIAKITDLSPGTGNVFEIDGYSIALFNIAGEFYAIDNICPHKGGALGEGKLKGEIVTCPQHGARFNVKTGALIFPPARTGVKVFTTKVVEKDIFLEIE